MAPLRKTDGLIYSDAKSKADIQQPVLICIYPGAKGQLADLGISTHPEMTPITINEAGVRKLLQNIKPHKAAGPDNIPARILREAANNLAPAMTILFQASIDQGTLPDDWKTANVAPIFKKGDRCKAANYRPVSLTCISCKLMEHVISSSMMRHLDDNGILTDTQHGFRKHRSCESQLISTIHDLAKGIEDRKQTDVVLLDFSKAFDKVPHLRLLQKLDHYGIRGDTRRWIAQFIQGRDQKVLLNGQHSTSAPVHSGVPQGTVLGPILFLVFINDLPDCVQSPVRLFADDCVQYRMPSDATQMQDDLNNLQKWEDKWLMEFHPEKCLTIRITNKRNIIKTDYQIHGQTLQTVDSAKYLGVNIQSKLNWSPHIATTAHKADNTRAFLQRNMRSCPRNVRSQCYTTLVRPILEYCSPVWDPHLQ